MTTAVVFCKDTDDVNEFISKERPDPHGPDPHHCSCTFHTAIRSMWTLFCLEVCRYKPRVEGEELYYRG